MSRIMAVLSESHGEVISDWELSGLLHDLDYDDTVDDREHHGVKAAEALSGLLDEAILQAIRSHDHRSGYQPSSLLDHSLRFANTVSFLVTEPADIIERYQMPEGLSMSELIKQFS